ncbi:hypothetical protein BAUCODRAFT_207939 [Baudoinia panamericana UAMH 10762]|uniref:F-box domain-containing protein n=1 Tax=Baudoinia panamericana (strain UAMH 10762) TaxID=717646 RepID=M2MB85_BAUPA|nr:uncharacterized protein BAUCODRAFT_207939 [Baudoinia panamericana UAMH 10762]EMC93751.1 hypothetical protein BAUCODRAFT_207939 [Baudoinia panamericana UAMH 10762]
MPARQCSPTVQTVGSKRVSFPFSTWMLSVYLLDLQDLSIVILTWLSAVMVSLNDDIYRLIIQAAGENSHDGFARDEDCVKTLLACCLVCRTWRRLAQPILRSVIVINFTEQLDRRLLDRSHDELCGVTELVLGESWDRNVQGVDLEIVWRALPTSQLRGLFCYGPTDRRFADINDKALIGSVRHLPSRLSQDFTGLREAVLSNLGGGAFWTPLLLAAPNLRSLTLYQASWSGRSVHADSPLYLPNEAPPFSLQHFELVESHVAKAPLVWLLSNSADSLKHVAVNYMDRERDDLISMSQLRADGKLPSVTHLTVNCGDSYGMKNYEEVLSGPLGRWSGLQTMFVQGDDDKARAAIIHGVSQLQPSPVVELGVGEMKMAAFKALWRLRKGKLRAGSLLRLVSKPTTYKGRYRPPGRWDWQAAEYWRKEDVASDASTIAAKYGVKLEIAEVSHFL